MATFEIKNPPQPPPPPAQVVLTLSIAEAVYLRMLLGTATGEFDDDARKKMKMPPLFAGGSLYVTLNRVLEVLGLNPDEYTMMNYITKKTS